MSQTQPPEEVLAGKQVDINAIDIPEAAGRKITAKTGENRVQGAAESLRDWARVPGQDPMPLQQALDLVRTKGAILYPDQIPGLDVDAARNIKAMGLSTPATEAVAQAYRKFYGVAVPSSAGTQDFVDTRVEQTKVQPPTEKKVKKVTAPKEPEQLKTELSKTVNHPKLYPYLQKVPCRYMWGQNGLYGLEFKSDIDKAIYLSSSNKRDSEGYYSKELSKTKIDFREWLFEVTGLDYNDNNDYDKLTIYRKKILKIINQILNSGLLDDPVIVPPVYDGYFQDIDDDEEEEDENEIDKTEDDVEDLDDISDEDISDKKISEDIKEEVVDAVEEDDEDKEDPMAEADIDAQSIVAGDTDEITDAAKKLLAKKINKPKKESSYTSNKKIFDSMVVNFGRLQSTLDTINNSLEKQNSLIKANIDTQLAIGELVSNQTELLGEKFDAILKEFEKQSDRAKDIADDEKRKAAEDSLEGQRDAAGTRDIDDLTKGEGKSKRGSKIADYYKQKALRRLYRAMPKRLRGGIRKARKIKQTPSRIAARMTRGITNRMPSSVKRVASGASAIKSASKMTNIPGAKTGPLRTLFAGMEYGERKGSGQSELQALGGTGAGLAGGAAGGVGGAKIGAIAGTAIGGAIGFLFGGVGAAPGAAIGLKIGTVAGSLIGGWLGAEKASELADKVTGADKITGQYETGGLIGPGYSQSNKQTPFDMSPMSSVAGLMIGATTGFLNGAGAVAAPVAPVLKGISAQMARQYDVPSTLTQTNVGGSLPNLSGELKKVKEKGKQTTGEELSGIEKDLLETQDPQSFADKLMKMLDPEGKFQQLLQQINHNNPVGETGEGMATFGESGIDKGSGYNSAGWVHGHFQNSNKQSLVSDTLEVVKKLINSGVSTVITATNKDLTKDMSEDELRRHIESGVDGHKKYGSGVYAIDVSVPTGTKVPYELENIFDSKGPGGIVGTMKGRTTQVMHLAPGSKAGAAPGTTQVSPGATPTVQGLGRQGVTGNKDFGATSGVGSKGYMIVPGHAAGGGAPEEKKLVKQLAKNAYTNLKSKFPDANVHYQDTDSMFEDTDDGFKKQLAWFKQKEKEGWEILEVHMDASMESGQGTGRGVIAPTGELNPVEAHFAKNYGAFARGHRDLGAPNRGVGLVELGNMSPELQQSSKQNKVSKQQLDALTAPLERSLESALKISAPAQKPRFQSLQGKDSDADTKYLIVNQQAKPQITGQGSQSASSFVSIGDGRWRSQNEMSTTIRNLYMQRLGQ